ncbi:MAG TPA: purine-nucleoside phosphorylase [Candidatus Limnocylindria bacterium]|nr:purine-nucleoside phosphorylase [Candidatus Limnocylindria bacterium]
MADAPATTELGQRIDSAAAAIRDRLAAEPALATPRLGLVLGSGLGTVIDLLDPEPRLRIPYAEIPEVPQSGVAGHAGELVAGLVGGRPVLVLAGRVHAYEGYSHREVTILLRAAIRAGLETVVLTNAAGGLNPAFEPGELMLVSDHINLSGDNPLFGPNVEVLGPRFPALTDAYDPDLAARARAAAERTGVRLHEGVYVMLSGPTYETRAELRMLRQLGADAVGMSTVLEVIVARHAGVRVLAISLITNKATPDVETGATHDEVIEMGRIGAAKLTTLLGALLPEIA